MLLKISSHFKCKHGIVDETERKALCLLARKVKYHYININTKYILFVFIEAAKGSTQRIASNDIKSRLHTFVYIILCSFPRLNI